MNKDRDADLEYEKDEMELWGGLLFFVAIMVIPFNMVWGDYFSKDIVNYLWEHVSIAEKINSKLSFSTINTLRSPGFLMFIMIVTILLILGLIIMAAKESRFRKSGVVLAGFIVFLSSATIFGCNYSNKYIVEHQKEYIEDAFIRENIKGTISSIEGLDLSSEEKLFEDKLETNENDYFVKLDSETKVIGFVNEIKKDGTFEYKIVNLVKKEKVLEVNGQPYIVNE